MIQELDLKKRHQQLESALARLQEQLAGKSTKKDRRTGNNLDRDDLARNFAIREQRLAVDLVLLEKSQETRKEGNAGDVVAHSVRVAERRPFHTLFDEIF